MTMPIIKGITFSSLLLLSSWEGGAISSLAFAFSPPASTTTSRIAAPRDARVVATRVSSSSSSSSLEDGEVVAGDVGGRRSFLSSSAAAWASAVVVGCGSAPAAAVVAASSSTADYAAVAKDIAAIVRKDPSKGPTLVRLVSSGVTETEFLATRSLFVEYYIMRWRYCPRFHSSCAGDSLLLGMMCLIFIGHFVFPFLVHCRVDAESIDSFLLGS